MPRPPEEPGSSGDRDPQPRSPDASAARLRAMVDGLSAVVWEADARGTAFTFVSERAAELLGYPVEDWIGDPGFWPSILHDEDREATVAHCAAQTAACRDHDVVYRACTADGRVLWLHDMVHVVCDGTGAPVRRHGVTLDVTAEQRAGHTATLLADVGRVLAEPGDLAGALAALARVTAGPLGGSSTVVLLTGEGLPHTVVRARSGSGPPVVFPVEEHERAPAPLLDAVARAQPVVVADPPGGARHALVVPLVQSGAAVGGLVFATADPRRRYDEADVALGTEIGRRTALALEARHLRERADVLAEVAAGLARAATTAEAAEVIAEGVRRGLDVGRVSLHRLIGGGRLELLDLRGYPATPGVDRHTPVRLTDPLPLTGAVAAGEPLWIESPGELHARYPHLAGITARTGTHGLAVLPFRARGVVTGALALGFDRPRTFRPDDREFAARIAALAGPSFERTVEADERRSIAEILQRSLLPTEPPAVARMAIACRYLPGAEHTRAGGDWFDVLEVGGGRIAIAVGDVVGQGAPAAAVMGQLRSALAAHLLDGDGPGTALRKLNRFASRIDGALASTALCVVIDPEAGSLRWARAGHVPPLVVDGSGARYLEGPPGWVLGVPSAPPPGEEAVEAPPGTTLLLYTDGLVERRTETLDTGLARLAAVVAARAPLRPEALLDGVLGACLGAAAPPDDVAVVAARVGPPPLERRLPAHPAELAPLRAAIEQWAGVAALGAEPTANLQLVVGEAVANSVEHAYLDAPPDRGRDVWVRLDPVQGGVRGEVRDAGRWRVVRDPARGPGHGLAVIHGLAPGAEIVPGPDGTTVRFTLPG